jgi:hypothetical protein
MVSVPTPKYFDATGYTPIPLESLPYSFYLISTESGKYWSFNGNSITDGIGTPLPFSADKPSDLYSTTGTGTYRLSRTGYTGSQCIRHADLMMYLNSYVANNYDFAWKFLLKSGTTDQVILWNPYPGDGIGIYVLSDGTYHKIHYGIPTIYTLISAPTSSPTSSPSSSPTLGKVIFLYRTL